MNKISSERTGYTKTGFAKAGFGCCSHFKVCDMGKGRCFYDETDPVAKEYCAAYQRNERERLILTKVAATPVEKEIESVSSKFFEEEQLSLF